MDRNQSSVISDQLSVRKTEFRKQMTWLWPLLPLILLFIAYHGYCILGTGWAQPGNVMIAGQQYYVDSGVTNQAATGNGRSVKAFADLIGTTKRATLVFDCKSGDTEAYNFTTALDLTNYTNINFEFKNGAELVPQSGVTLILPAPGNVISNPNQQTVSGAGLVTFAKTGTIYPESYGAKGDGTTDDSNSVQRTINSLPNGGEVLFSGSTYLLTSGVTAAAKVQLTGTNRESVTLKAPVGVKIITIFADDVIISNLKLDGSYTTGATAGDYGLIDIANADRTKITNCYLTSSKSKAIAIRGLCYDTDISGNYFTNHFNSIYSISWSDTEAPQRIRICDNQFINNWGTGALSGAIKLSNSASYTASGSDFVISNNIIKNAGQMGIELWNRIYAASVVGNSVSQVDYGISLAGVTNSVVTGNVLSGVTAYGIEVGSASNGCVVNSNSIRMYTLGTSTKGGLSGILSSGVSSYYCEISDNVVIGCAGYGIYIVNSNYFNVVGNTLQDNATIQFYLGTSNYLNVTDNILNGTTQNFIFLDATSASMTDIEISNNIIRGSASSYGIWFTNATNPARTITNLRIIKNNVYAATAALKGNYSIFWTVSGWDMYNTVIEKNFFRDGGSYFVLPDWTSPDVVVRTMVLNGTMELDSNWNTSGATTNERSTTQKHSGTYSRKVVTNGANTGIYSDEFHLTSGYAYRATAWVYGNGVGVGYVKIYVPGGTDSYSPLSSLAGYVWPAAWTKQEWTFIADNNVQISNIMLMQGTVGGAGTFYLDDVSVVEDRLNVIGNAHISGRVNMSGLTDYANNAAAVAAGLAIGDIYHITGTDTLGVVHP